MRRTHKSEFMLHKSTFGELHPTNGGWVAVQCGGAGAGRRVTCLRSAAPGDTNWPVKGAPPNSWRWGALLRGSVSLPCSGSLGRARPTSGTPASRRCVTPTWRARPTSKAPWIAAWTSRRTRTRACTSSRARTSRRARRPTVRLGRSRVSRGATACSHRTARKIRKFL